jgi:hypothetical protein
MKRKHATSVVVGDVIDELGLHLVVEELSGWDGGVMLDVVDLITGEERLTWFAPFDEIDVLL